MLSLPDRHTVVSVTAGGTGVEQVVLLVGASHLDKPRREWRELHGLLGMREAPHEPESDIEMPRHEYTGWRSGSTVDKIDNP